MTKHNHLTLTVPTPRELKKILAEAAVTGSPMIFLALNGPNVFGRPFLYHDVTPKNLKNYIQADAMELLSLKADEIIFDYHIFKQDEKSVSGVFACIPRKELMQYLFVMDEYNVYPVVIIPYILASINAVFQTFKDKAENFCLLEFGKNNRLDFAVFTAQGCQLLRKIAFENENEMIKEILLSVRSVTAKSKVKEFKQLHVHGDLKDKDALISKLQSGLGMDLQRDDAVDVEGALLKSQSIFNVNLARDFSLPVRAQKRILMAANVALLLCLGLGAFCGWRVYQKKQELDTARSQYSADQLKLAKGLEQKLNQP